MGPADAAERVWYGRGLGAALGRLTLAPATALFRIGAGVRGALYDRGLLRSHALGLPALSVGNLTVGGTGKTPVAAWVCAQLSARGARPALLLRGVGGDEAQVHARLNPHVPVVPDPDRVRGAARAAALGAGCLVLDDAFQHRRARRDVDVVLVSAERFAADGVRLLPAGPYREGLGALRRASLVVVTRKSADAAAAARVADAVAERVPGLEVGVVHLAFDVLCRWEPARATAGDRRAAHASHPLAALAGAAVIAPAGLGDPTAFAAQLAAVGAAVDLVRYPDHHAYRDEDARRLADRARAAERRSTGPVWVVTTLKDAVKLGPRWPRDAPPLWYVSQRVAVERGMDALAVRLDAIAAAAHAPSTVTATP